MASKKDQQAGKSGQKGLNEDLKDLIPTKKDFFVVAVGASAGGLKAIEGFLKNLPESPGMAIVILQHQDPDRESLMLSILPKYTSLPVVWIEDGLEVKPDHVYVRPPDHNLVIREGRLVFSNGQSRNLPLKLINNFLVSLADDQGENAICVILSGAGGDGSCGLRAIHGNGGLVVAQDEREAQFSGMPHAAIETGMADFVMPVVEMGAKLVEYARNSKKNRGRLRSGQNEMIRDKDQDQVLRIVHSTTGHNFSRYKTSTIERRIRRRMVIHQYDDLKDYLTRLRKDEEEVHALFSDLLINVTSFFRDPDAFAALEKELAGIFAKCDGENAMRIWVPACATGEEAYSMAMLAVEAMDQRGVKFPIKIFATDINLPSIQTARNGLYPDSIENEIPERRLKRFFNRTGNRYRIVDRLREMVIFSPHNIVHDAPFSRIDLVSCRNMLIYMDQSLQRKIIPLLHYCLKPGGLLFLGMSEDVGGADLFEAVQRNWKIFRSRPGSRQRRNLEHGSWEAAPVFPLPEFSKKPGWTYREKTGGNKKGGESIRQVVEMTLIDEIIPPAVLVDEDNQILYFHGDTGPFFHPPRGDAVFDLFSMARFDLAETLKTILAEVRENDRALRRRSGLYSGQRIVQVDLSVRSLSRRRGEKLLLVIFQEVETEEPEKQSCGDGQVEALKRELDNTARDLQATIQELETNNEEMQSINAEMQANSEEMQSTNEELETSREELQSTNEELETVNSELQNKNEELKETNDDMKNLFETTDICTIIVNNELRIKRFTPAATRIFRLIESDLGRPITDITSDLVYEHFQDELEAVIEKLERVNREVRTRDGRWFNILIAPYRTREKVIAGAVLTFADISQQKEMEFKAQEGKLLADNIIETLHEPMVVLDGNLVISRANPAFFRFFRIDSGEALGASFIDIGDKRWHMSDLEELLKKVIPQNREIRDYRLEAEIPNLGRRALLLNGRRIDRGKEREMLVLLTFLDVSGEPGENGGN